MIPVRGFENRKVAVLGLGRSGKATVAALEAGGAEVIAWDDGVQAREAAEAAGIALVDFTRHGALEGVAALITSPGIPHLYPAPHPAIAAAWEAGVRRRAVRPGETVLVMGGAGGVGSFAVQFAKAAGAYVIATASAENLPVLKELGADLALDYRGPWAEEVLKATEGQGVDAAFETAGESLVERVIPVVRPFGRIATILPPQGNLSGLYTKNQTLYGVFLTRERKRLLEMRPLFERGLARPLIAEVLPFSLENLRKAHARMDSGHGRGKIVLTFQA